jgi:hypothetical protein
MRTSEQINELAGALAKAQRAFTAAERAHIAKVTSKKGEGSSYSYNYADLQAYLDVVREPLAMNGLSFVQLPTVSGDVASVTTLLMHASGQFIESDPLTLSVDHDQDRRPTPQAVGSTLTYCRRYSLSAITGMASEADDDGMAGSGVQGEAGKRAPKPECPKCHSNQYVYEDRQKGGFFCWKKPVDGKNGCGHNWLPDDEQPLHEPEEQQESRRKGKAEKVAADTGLTTGDKVQPPVNSFATCETALNARVKDVDTAAKYFAFVKEQKIGHHLTAEQYADLDKRGVAKLIDLCDTEADFAAAEKIVRGLHGELRILPEEFGAVATQLADAKEAKLGATV